MRRTWVKNGKKKIVWRCSNRVVNGTKYCKKSPSIEEAVLQAAILQAINGCYGAERIAAEPIIAKAAPKLYLKEQAEQLKQSVAVLLFLAATGQPEGYEQQLGFVEKMIHDFKACQLGEVAEAPIDAKDDITCLNAAGWDEMEIWKLVKEAVVMTREKIKVIFADRVAVIVQC